MTVISPSVIRMGASLAHATALLNAIGCTSVHMDVTVGKSLPTFPDIAVLNEGQLAGFTGDVVLHVFPSRTVTKEDLVGIRQNDTALFHVYPGTTYAELDAYVTASASVGCRVGVALDLDADLPDLQGFLGCMNSVYVMGIPVATSGLPPATNTAQRIHQVREMVGSSCRIGIDGGVNAGTFLELASITDELVIGGLLFDASEIRQQWHMLNSSLREVGK